jgi:hypothetical protein
MTMLTLDGLIILASFDPLHDPANTWERFNRLLPQFRLPIWQEKGDIPRWAPPDHPVKEVVDAANALAQNYMLGNLSRPF